jgi:Na+/melibiose symporter-like transporter
MKTKVVHWRRTATAVGIVALFLTGLVVRRLPGSSGIGFLAWFMIVSTTIVAAVTFWLVPRSHRSE